MKDILLLMAKYNRKTNADMFEILGTLDEPQLTAKTGSYHGSIIDLLNHILSADVGWLRAFRDGDPAPAGLDDPALDQGELKWRRNLHETLDALATHRSLIDDFFVAFVEANDEKVFQASIEMRRGSHTTTFTLGQVLMHVLNHQTHHRGSIAQILDVEGVDNDYSNLHRMLMD